MIPPCGLALVAAAMMLTGLTTGTAAAASECGDYHWIGAAGSGQRDGAALAANDGMGDVVYQSYQQLRADLAASGAPSPPRPCSTRPRRCRWTAGSGLARLPGQRR